MTLLMAALATACSSSAPLASDAGPADGGPPDVVADAPVDAGPDGRGDGPGCQGENPALRCRVSPQDCVPSTCACSEQGWACTADCGGGRFCGDAGADGATPAQRCQATGGTSLNALCCLATPDFPDSCSVGACGCAPASSHMVAVCQCPAGTCFLPERGCVLPACTPGADQTCNDDPVVSAVRGRCLSDLTCACAPGFTVNVMTGKCR